MRVAVALAVSAGLAVILAHVAGAEARYADRSGDGTAATELTEVLVSNDAAGWVSFRIAHPNPTAARVAVLLDTDRSSSTGATSLRGAEYRLDGPRNRPPTLYRWTGSGFAGVPTQTLGWTFEPAHLVITVNRGDLANTRGFAFWVHASDGPELFSGQRDDAPDSGTWRYQLTGTQPVSLSELVERVRSGVIRIEVEGCGGREIASGILIGPRHVATVEHVVADATAIVLRRGSKRLGSARVVGRDSTRDLALLQSTRPIAGHRFALGPSQARVGEPVAVLGFPVGLPLSVTRGSVSGVNRSVRIDGVTRRGLLQTDAAVNHGNSGGPLLAVETGKLLGLVDIGSTRLKGIAFAVSAAGARPLVNAWKASPQPRPPARCG